MPQSIEALARKHAGEAARTRGLAPDLAEHRANVNALVLPLAYRGRYMEAWRAAYQKARRT